MHIEIAETSAYRIFIRAYCLSRNERL